MMPKVSVIIPVYNVEKYLQDCIDSLLAQTIEDIEFIFIDDVSTDSSLKILEENLRRWPEKIRVIKSPENRRQGAARNLGIRAAKGDYIGFVDSDDFVLETMYETLYKEIVKTGADACFIEYIQVPNEVDLKSVSAYRNLQKCNVLPNWSKELFSKNGVSLDAVDITNLITENLGGIWCGLWKKSVIVNNNVWFPEKLSYEDNYWASLMRCYLKKISFVNQVGYVYRLSTDSTMRVKNAVRHYDRVTVEKMLYDELKDRSLWDKHIDAWEWLFVSRYCFNTYFHFLERFDNPDMKFLKELLKDLSKTFPKWRTNRYLKLYTSKKYQLLCNLIMIAPCSIASVLKRKVR